MALGGVCGFFLDVFLEYCPGQIPKTETPVFGGVEEKILRIHRLVLRDLDVDLSEVRGKAMSDENTSQIEKKPELLVCNLEWDKIMLAGSQI